MSAPYGRTTPEEEDVPLSVEERSGSTVKPFDGTWLRINIRLSEHVLHQGKSSHILHGLMDDGTTVVVKKRPISEISSSRAEKNILCNLTHHGIVRVKWYSEDDEFSYLVLDSVESTLEERIEKVSQHTNMEEKKTDLKNLTVKVLEGLNVLHVQKFLHGDVKQRNVLVDGEGQPKWIDFTSSEEVTSADDRKMKGEIRSAGELAYYILSGGENYTGDKTSWDVGDLEWDFITRMTKEEKSLKEALDHPVFWNKNRKLRYLEALGNLYKEFTNKLQQALKDKKRDVAFENWKSKMKEHFPTILEEMEKKREDGYLEDVLDLLRFIRNFSQHRSEEEMVFLSLFPDLFEKVYFLARDMGWNSKNSVKRIFSEW